MRLKPTLTAEKLVKREPIGIMLAVDGIPDVNVSYSRAGGLPVPRDLLPEDLVPGPDRSHEEADQDSHPDGKAEGAELAVSGGYGRGCAHWPCSPPTPPPPGSSR